MPYIYIYMTKKKYKTPLAQRLINKRWYQEHKDYWKRYQQKNKDKYRRATERWLSKDNNLEKSRIKAREAYWLRRKEKENV